MSSMAGPGKLTKSSMEGHQFQAKNWSCASIQTLGLEEYVADNWLAIIFTNVELLWSTPTSQLFQTTSYQDPARLSYPHISWVVPANWTGPQVGPTCHACFICESPASTSPIGEAFAQEGGLMKGGFIPNIFWWIPGSLTDRKHLKIGPSQKERIVLIIHFSGVSHAKKVKITLGEPGLKINNKHNISYIIIQEYIYIYEWNWTTGKHSNPIDKNMEQNQLPCMVPNVIKSFSTYSI